MKVREIAIHEGNRFVIARGTEYRDPFVCLAIFSDEPVADELIAQELVGVKDHARHIWIMVTVEIRFCLFYLPLNFLRKFSSNAVKGLNEELFFHIGLQIKFSPLSSTP